MKIKSVLVGALLTYFFSVFGLFYSSTSAALRTLFFSVLITILWLITGDYIFIGVLAIQHSFVILLSGYIINKQNIAIINNERYSLDSSLNYVTEVIIQSLICLFLTCATTAFLDVFDNSILFYGLLIIISFVISLLPVNNKINYPQKQ